MAGRADRSHPALKGLDITEIDARVRRQSLTTPDDDTKCDDFTTSIVALIAGQCNESGFVGVAPGTGIDVINIFNRGMTTNYEIAKALICAEDRQADVVMLAIGGSNSSLSEHEAIKDAVAKGMCIVAPAGDKRGIETIFPAAFPECVSVCSIDSNGKQSAFSGFGEFAVPGENIWSCGIDGRYISVTGTAYSAAIVTGIVAMLYQLAPSWRTLQMSHYIKHVLMQTDLVDWRSERAGKVRARRKKEFGDHGIVHRINAYLALLAVRRLFDQSSRR